MCPHSTYLFQPGVLGRSSRSQSVYGQSIGDNLLEIGSDSRVDVGAIFRSDFCVGGVSVRLIGNRSADVSLGLALEPFRTDLTSSAVSLTVEWVGALPSVPGRKLFDSGCIWRVYDAGGEFQFDFNAPVLGEQPYKRLLVDRSFRKATLLMSEECFARISYPPEPLEYPLDELLIMHRLTQEEAIELHGAGIVSSYGVGNLFVGHSGAGKSTTTRLWTEREQVEVLSDDRIIVRRDAELGAPTEVETPFGAAGCADEHGVLRLRDCSASRSNHSAQDDKGQELVPRFARNDNAEYKMRMYGTPWHGEAMYASPGSVPLARIFILEHGHGNAVTPLSPSRAVAELFARSFVPFHRHEYVESALQFLQEVVDAVPVYRFAFEPDERAVDTILNFHD
jgi:hypothetical protein